MLVKWWTRAQRGCRTYPQKYSEFERTSMDLLWAVVWTRNLQAPLLPHGNLWFGCGCRTVEPCHCTTALHFSNLSPKACAISVHSAHTKRTDLLMYHRNALAHRKKTPCDLKEFQLPLTVPRTCSNAKSASWASCCKFFTAEVVLITLTRAGEQSNGSSLSNDFSSFKSNKAW